jgi:hypothetical protein
MEYGASFIRAMLVALTAFVLAGGPACAQNFQEPTGSNTYVRSTNAGEVDGQILSMDYTRSLMTVQTKARGKIDVLVLPSTTIVDKGNGYASEADLKRGAHVKLFLSKRANTYNAQIIQLL